MKARKLKFRSEIVLPPGYILVNEPTFKRGDFFWGLNQKPKSGDLWSVIWGLHGKLRSSWPDIKYVCRKI